MDAWEYLEFVGVVTDTCFPYTAGVSGFAPPCISQCSDKEPFTKYMCTNGTLVSPSDVPGIKSELYNNGPMQGGFDFYEDFFSYKSGVYHHVTGALVGGHSIKVIGWGTENGMDYWLCANYWGPTWGEQGFFKI